MKPEERAIERLRELSDWHFSRITKHVFHQNDVRNRSIHIGLSSAYKKAAEIIREEFAKGGE